jgi:hypothetical protein
MQDPVLSAVTVSTLGFASSEILSLWCVLSDLTTIPQTLSNYYLDVLVR